MELNQGSMREFVAVATGSSRFRVKLMPTATLHSELHTETSREIRLLCLADDTYTFILHNKWVDGDDWSEELGDYTAMSGRQLSSARAWTPLTGWRQGPTAQPEWSDGSIAWNAVPVELLPGDEAPATFAVGGALVYTTGLAGTPHEFLVELELTGPAEEWRLRRSAMGPAGFTLARQKSPSEVSA